MAAQLRLTMRLVLVGVACASEVVAQSPARRVVAQTLDSGRVVADHLGSGNRGVVLVHGGRYTRRHWGSLPLHLASDGAQVLAIDLRGYGESRRNRLADIGQPEEALDVQAAVRWLGERGTRDVTVIGASLGGGAAASAALEPQRAAETIDALVLLAPTRLVSAERIRARLLVVIGATDTTASGALRFTGRWEDFRRGAGPREMCTVDSGAHGPELLLRGDSAQVMGVIRRFLRR